MALEKLPGFGDAHLQHVGDCLPAELHLEGLVVVPVAATLLTGNCHVRQEVHVDGYRPLAATLLAAPALDVKRESALVVAPALGQVGLCEQLPNVIEHAGVGRGVRPRRPPDRRLIDQPYRLDPLDSLDRVVGARVDARIVVHLPGQAFVQDLVHQGRLPGAGDPGDRGERPQRHRHVDVLKIVLARPADGQLSVGIAALFRDRDRPLAGEVLARDAVLGGGDILDGPGDDDLAASLAGPGPDVDDVIGTAHRLGVVFDHDQCVAQIPQLR